MPAGTNSIRKTSKTSAYFTRSKTAAKTKTSSDGLDDGEKVMNELPQDEDDTPLQTSFEIVNPDKRLAISTTTAKHSKSASSPRRRKKPQGPKTSPYFRNINPLSLTEEQLESCLPFPPLSAPSFGLIQEQLAHCPFRLLIATIFLNRTRGPVAIPVLFQLFSAYPTIQSMADARHEDIVRIIQKLGFQNQRARKFVALARMWLQHPPDKTRRWRKLHYPCRGDGLDVPASAALSHEGFLGPADPRVGWEVAHLPGVGAYALDSWRIFCRDDLLLGKDQEERKEEAEVEAEWKRVRPRDKELRAYLTWKWLKEGWIWDPETGEKTLADADLLQRAERGGVLGTHSNGRWFLDSVSTDRFEQHDVLPVRRAGFSLDAN